MKEIIFIIILTFLNLVLTAQRNDTLIERLTFLYKGDSALFKEQYEIDIEKKKVFYLTPIMNYLDIKGTKYRTRIKGHRQTWTELTGLINRIDFSKLDSSDKKKIKSPYYIEAVNLKQETLNYPILSTDELVEVKNLFETIRKIE
jgi:hypothetical protein